MLFFQKEGATKYSNLITGLSGKVKFTNRPKVVRDQFPPKANPPRALPLKQLPPRANSAEMQAVLLPASIKLGAATA